MIFVWTLLIAVVASSASGNRIVGGEPTTIDQYPGIVQVEFRNGILWGQNCAANILTHKTVVSAAHCFDGFFYTNRNRRIRAGSSNRNSGGTVIGVSNRVNHPSYGRSGHDGDISIVILSSNLVYSNVIAPVSIVVQGYELPDNVAVVQAGWGALRSGGQGSAVLRHVQTLTVNRSICAQRYQQLSRPQVVTENMICVGILDVGGKDACQYDSGGPLYLNNDILIGIVSWGEGCGEPAYPGVNTKISSYTNWIQENAV